MRSSKKSLTVNQKNNLTGWTFLLPATLLICAMNFYPMIQAFFMSFQSGIGNNQVWSGLSNYKRLLEDKVFQTALVNNFVYLIVQVPIMLVLALVLASCLNMKNLKFKGLFRTAIFLPCCTSLVSYAIIFKSLFAYDGYVNTILLQLGLIDSRVNWLGQTNTAKIDGASPIKAFFKITVPLLKPTILLTAIMSTNGTLQLFDESVNLTNGGPANSTLTMSHYIYKVSFEYSSQFGYAAAISYVIFILVAILAFVQMKVGDKR